jgi:Tfp pilus assembly protein PilO
LKSQIENQKSKIEKVIMASEDVKRLFVLISFFLFVFLTFFFLFWRPRLTDVRRYQRELRDKQAELIQLERDAQDWPDTITREMLEQYEDKLERLWSLIPSEEEVSVLLDEIQTHAKSANLEILSLARSSTPAGTSSRSARSTATASAKSKKAADEPSRYIRVPYKISLGGGYSGLVRFLRRLEDSERLVTVIGMTMRAGQGRHPVDAEIQFNIFYSKVGVEG